jgi:4-hydroxy-2-oxoglutarate aldolase
MLGGVLAPVVTPFARDGEIEGAAFMMNARAHIESGLSGIVTSGSTGEAALLMDTERAELLQLVRPIVPADRWLIAGVGAESTRATIKRAKDAAARGADAVLVVAPHYYGSQMTVTALSAHFHRVADESPVPIVLYNIPKYAHFSLAPELVATLSRHHNVIGIKDSSGDQDCLRGYLLSQTTSFTVLTGSGSSLLEALELGASGGILAVACFAVPLVREVYAALQRGDRATAARAQEALVPLAKEIVGTYGPAGVKAAMQIVGLRGGSVRMPLLDLSEADVARVRALLQALA